MVRGNVRKHTFPETIGFNLLRRILNSKQKTGGCPGLEASGQAKNPIKNAMRQGKHTAFHMRQQIVELLTQFRIFRSVRFLVDFLRHPFYPVVL